VPSSNWTSEQQGAKQVELAGLNQVTITIAVTLLGELLPLPIMYP